LYKVVLDTNIFISAIVFGGKPRNILEYIIQDRIKLFISEEILDEISGILSGGKFRYPPQIVHTIVTQLESISEMVYPKVKIKEIKDDPDDNKFLECAVTGNADFIISGDAHLLKLGTYKGIRIISPAEFLTVVSSL
jgi:hypothetical protein